MLTCYCDANLLSSCQDFHPRMVSLTGTPQQVGAAARQFRVYFSDVDREEDSDDYVGTLECFITHMFSHSNS